GLRRNAEQLELGAELVRVELEQTRRAERILQPLVAQGSTDRSARRAITRDDERDRGSAARARLAPLGVEHRAQRAALAADLTERDRADAPFGREARAASRSQAARWPGDTGRTHRRAGR